VQIREKLARRASKAGVSVPGSVLDKLELYFELLRKWNRKVSLTALPVEDAGDEAIDRLLIEPLVAARFLPCRDAIAIDIGSGGGSPAIPLKVLVPGVSMRMVESKTRKAAFLREVIRALELDKTEVEAVRFEELLIRPALHDATDVLTMRAVKIEAKTLAGLQSFLKPNGLLFLFGTQSAAATKATSSHFTLILAHPLIKQWGSQLEILQKRSS
jgi:16S rRNA (guanine527-N7)-methyltransferase